MRRLTKYSIFLFAIFLVQCKSNSGGPDIIDDTDTNGYNETTFFSTNGSKIINRQGIPVVIRGFGLGGWLMPEGYMFNMPGGFGPLPSEKQL